jgi:hypothetical protein
MFRRMNRDGKNLRAGPETLIIPELFRNYSGDSTP